jgi:GNAT superfamily N-acetyltransferase
LTIRAAQTPRDIDQAIALDEGVIGSRDRGKYIRSIAENGGLSLAEEDGEVLAFCCLDHRYFFEKPFISLLIVRSDARRRGLGRALLQFNEHKDFAELWTSTNRSNLAMKALLKQGGWRYCGELNGLEEGDPELFFKKNL